MLRRVLWPGRLRCPTLYEPRRPRLIRLRQTLLGRRAQARPRAAKTQKPPAICAVSLPEHADTDAQASQEQAARKRWLNPGQRSHVPIRNAQSDFNLTRNFHRPVAGPDPARSRAEALQRALAAYKAALCAHPDLRPRFCSARVTRPSAAAKNKAAWASRAIQHRQAAQKQRHARASMRGKARADDRLSAREGHADRIQAPAPATAANARSGIAARDAIRPVAKASASASRQAIAARLGESRTPKPAPAPRPRKPSAASHGKARPGAGTANDAAQRGQQHGGEAQRNSGAARAIPAPSASAQMLTARSTSAPRRSRRKRIK